MHFKSLGDKLNIYPGVQKRTKQMQNGVLDDWNILYDTDANEGK